MDENKRMFKGLVNKVKGKNEENSTNSTEKLLKRIYACLVLASDKHVVTSKSMHIGDLTMF